MANILGDDTKQQILALGRLGWPLRRIEQATGVRRETASAYLKAAGIAIRAPRRRRPPPKPASEVSTDPAETSSHRILGAYPTIPRSDDNKDAVIAPISLCPNRGKSADFVLISGQ